MTIVQPLEIRIHLSLQDSSLNQGNKKLSLLRKEQLVFVYGLEQDAPIKQIMLGLM